MLTPLIGLSYASFMEDLEQCPSTVMPRFKRGIQYVAAYRLTH
jgi:hypothetical protein